MSRENIQALDSYKFQVSAEDKTKYDTWFDALRPQSGRLSEEKARNFLKMLFEQHESTLDKIWKLSDQYKDGLLDRYEFTVAYHLTDRAYDGWYIPDQVVMFPH